jgi:DNA-nicking Smr family endonuclease
MAKRSPTDRSPEAELPPTGDESDAEELARAMADVVPLRSDRPARLLKPRPVPIMRRVDEPEPATEPLGSDFVAPGVDRRELRKLRRGTYTIQHRLDLHGQTLASASTSVHRFIQESRSARHRCVCIVHGRGLNSPGGVSVLKGAVRQQLTRMPGVLAFCDAPTADGGTGAVYVLLRR